MLWGNIVFVWWTDIERRTACNGRGLPDCHTRSVDGPPPSPSDDLKPLHPHNPLIFASHAPWQADVVGCTHFFCVAAAFVRSGAAVT